MFVVRAGPNQYLLTGRGGRLENRGSAVQAIVGPGTVYVLVPSTKQEAAFEFTQETRDGIPLRFKGIIVYRLTDPVAAARQFDFGTGFGAAQISALLTDVVLGELRDAVSHMTMAECIEGRKAALSQVVRTALETAVAGSGAGDSGWGIGVEVAQLAQVFIVDAALRQQLEAEVRNEIRLKSEQSDIRTREEARLAEMASDGRVQEQKLAADQERLRRDEALTLAQLASERRTQAEKAATERHALGLELERFHAQTEADEDRATTSAPVRILELTREREVLAEELATRRLRNEAQVLEVERELMLPRAQQALRREILPLEQVPQIVNAASRVLAGTNLSIYGEDARLAGQLAPVLELLGGAVRQATREVIGSRPASAPDAAG